MDLNELFDFCMLFAPARINFQQAEIQDGIATILLLIP